MLHLAPLLGPAGSACRRGTFSSRLILPVILAILVFSGSCPLEAATLTEVRSEFQINEKYTYKGQHHATVSMDSQGLFLVTWNTHSNEWEEIQGRAYFSDGQPWTNDFLVNQQVQKGDQYSPDVETGGGEEWVVVWPSSETDSTTYIYAKLYSSQNTRKRLEFIVDPDSPPSVERSRPDVGMFPNGDFIVIWETVEPDSSVMNYYVRLFDNRGNALTDRVQINQTPSATPPPDLLGLPEHTGTPDIAVAEVDGEMKVFAAWQRWHAGVPEWTDIVGRAFNLHTMTFEDEFEISHVDSGASQGRPLVDMNGKGDILIVWQELDTTDDRYDVHTRKYSAGGMSWGPIMDPPGNEVFEQHRGQGLLSESGGMVLAWTRIEPLDGADNVYLMMYDDQGDPLLDTEYRVNTTMAGIQRRPAVAMKEAGGMTHLAVVWECDQVDGSDFGVCGAVYDFDGFPDVSAKVPYSMTKGLSRRPPSFGLGPRDLNLEVCRQKTEVSTTGNDGILTSYPNPFNPTTRISFRLDHPATVRLDIHDLAGRRIKVLVGGESLAAGEHDFTWYGRDQLDQPVASGLYLVRLSIGGKAMMRRVTLVR